MRSELFREEYFIKNGPFPASFSVIFVFSIQLINKLKLSLTGFELRISGVGTDLTTYCGNQWEQFWQSPVLVSNQR